MKILIIGASSFIGFNISNYLSKYHSVICTLTGNKNKYRGIKKKRLKILGSKVSFLKLNLKNFRLFEKIIFEIRPEIVINAAGYSVNYYNYKFNLKKSYQINYYPLKNINNILEKYKTSKFIHIGSSWEYPQSISYCNEKINNDPIIPYGKEKKKVTEYLRSLSKKNKFLNIIVVRIFNLFGDYDNNKKLIPNLINKLTRNKSVELTDCKIFRDYMHVNDLSLAINKLIKKKKYYSKFEIFNICSSIPIKVKDLVLKICSYLKKNKILLRFGKISKRNFESRYFIGSNRKLRRYISWKPMSFKNSLKMLVSQCDIK
jgi:nucleoside-diphosphate-sugar epimerase